MFVLNEGEQGLAFCEGERAGRVALGVSYDFPCLIVH
jgi:hypothetical protein